jgi:hypothetical protein
VKPIHRSKKTFSLFKAYLLMQQKNQIIIYTVSRLLTTCLQYQSSKTMDPSHLTILSTITIISRSLTITTSSMAISRIIIHRITIKIITLCNMHFMVLLITVIVCLIIDLLFLKSIHFSKEMYQKDIRLMAK